MNVQQAIDLTQSIMGYRSDLVTRIVSMLDLAQEFYERGPVYPWFLLSETSVIVTQIGERRVPFPANFIGEYEEAALYYEDAELEDNRLEKHDYDYLIRKTTAIAVGKPCAYSMDGTYFNLFPIPDALYTISTKFYKKDIAPSTLSVSGTNKWLTNAPNCLVGWAGQQLAASTRDTIAGMQFQMLESAAKAQLAIQNEDKKHSNRVYQIGGPV